MSKKLKIGLSIATIFSLVFLVGATKVQAQGEETVTPDYHISQVTVADGYSTNPGATTDYAISLKFKTDFPDNSDINVQFQSQSCPPEQDWRNCQFDLSNATVSGINGEVEIGDNWFHIMTRAAISKNTTKTITVRGVKNPTTISGSYKVWVNTYVYSDPQPPQGPYGLSSNAILLGNVIVKGTVTMPDGNTPVRNVGVNLRSEDFSTQIHSNTDENGFYAIVSGGSFRHGTYWLEAWPPSELQGVMAPDPIQVSYTGTTLTKNFSLGAATKTLQVTVLYNTSGAVTTANVWASKRGGGAGMGGDVDSNGKVTLTLSGGSWDIGVGSKWDPENNRQVNVDWTYNEPPKIIDFANNNTRETKSITFTVTKADAAIKGYVKLPDGSALPGGFVDIRKGEGQGMGTGIDSRTGYFRTAIPAGDYKIMIWPDTNQNPDLSKYYSPEIAVHVEKGQTKDLGTVTMLEKNSKITGKVIDENGNGVADVRVNCWSRSGFGWSQATSGSDGSYTLWVSAGEWEVGIDQNPDSDYISIGGRPSSITIQKKETVSGINLTVKIADARVNVKIVDDSGKAISNIFGYAYARKKGGGFGSGNEFGSGVNQGTATIKLLGGDTYIFGVNMPPEDAGYSLEKEVEKYIAVGEKSDLKLTLLENDATISGWLQDQDGNLVTGVEGEVFAMDENFGWHPSRLNPDGSFSISVLGGRKYSLGYWLRTEEFVKTHPDNIPFLVPADSTVTKVLTAFRADSLITGKVVDPNGSPLPHAWVGASNFRLLENKMKGDFEGGKVIDTGTEAGSDGTFSLPIVAGDYDVFAGLPPEFQSAYMPPKETTVTVTPTSPANVTLQFRASDATLIATGTLEDGSTPEWGFCWAWSEEGGFSGAELSGGTANVPLTLGTWHTGCDTHMPGQGAYRSNEKIVNVTAKGTLSNSYTLYKALFDLPEGITETFSATAQKVITLPDGTKVTIPANALATSGNVTLIAEPDMNLFQTKDTKSLNYAWDFSALDSNSQLITSFNSNVNICIPYDDDYLNSVGVNEDNIVAKYYDSTSGSWKLPDGVTQDIEANVICFSVSHFTDFALTTGSTVGGGAANHNIIATPLASGGPQVIIADENGNILANFFAYDSSLRIEVDAVAADVDGDGDDEIITVPGAGGGPQVRVFDQGGNYLAGWFAYDSSLRCGIHVTAADINGDAKDEIITTPMAGCGPQVKVFDGNGNVSLEGFIYAESFRGGVTAVPGDVDGDGVEEVVFVPDSNAGPQIVVSDLGENKVLAEFFAYASTVRGGYNVETGDVDGDGDDDIVVSPKAGLGPQVAVFDGQGNLLTRFFAYAPSFRGGIYASVGDVDGDGDNDIVTTPESSAGPQVRVFDRDGNVLSQFWAYASTLRGSFTSFVADLNGDGTTEIITAPGEGMGPQVRTFNQNGQALSQFFSHHTGFRGGIHITSIAE